MGEGEAPEFCVTTPTIWRTYRYTPWCCPTTRSTRECPASLVPCPAWTCPSGGTPPTTPPPPPPSTTDSANRRKEVEQVCNLSQKKSAIHCWHKSARQIRFRACF